MAPYLVLLVALLSRILPHTFHVTGMNFTAIGGGLLFFGSRLGRTNAHRGLNLALALVALIATDVYLTKVVYGFPFEPSAYLVTWTWYAAVCLLGFGLLGQKITLLRTVAAVLVSSTSFFLLSNFAVWAGSALYPRTAAGLAACFTAAIPFYNNDLASTTLTATALFGLPALATRLLQRTSPAQPTAL